MSLYFLSYSSRRRLVALLLGLGSLGVFSILAPSCSSEEDSSKRAAKRSSGGSSSADLEDLKSDVTKLGKAAKKTKVSIYDKKNWERAKKALAAAKKNPDTAAINYKRAMSALKKGITKAKKARKDLASVKKLHEEVEDLRDKVQEDGAEENAPDLVSQGDKFLEEAIEALDKPSATTARTAGTALAQAKAIFEDAARVAIENKAFREQATAAKASIEPIKQQGFAKGADAKALSTWSQAEQQLAAADRMMATADLQSALQSYQAAKQSYIRALGEVTTAEERSQQLAQNVAEQEKYQQRMREEEEARRKQQYDIERLKAEEKRRGFEALGGRSRGGAIGESFDANEKPRLPDGTDPADYAQNLDEEDEAFLAEHIDKLSKVISYDPETGAITLNYRRGPDLRKDLGISPKSRVNAESLRARKYLSFKNEFMEDTSRDITDPNLPKNMEQGPSRFTFECNTQGSFFLPVPFRWIANVTYAMQILTMDGNGSFNVLMMANPGRKDGYITDFIHLGKLSNGRQLPLKRMGGEFKGSANYWFEKKRAVWMVNEYMRPDPENPEGGPSKSGVMSVTYDAQEDATINKVPVKSFERGYVGFRWFRVKAEVRKLYVTGILDKEEAVKVLRKRLKIRKSKKKKSKVSRGSKKEKEKDAVASGKKPPSEGGKRKVGSKEDFDLNP
jgi:hypothetical protein